MTGSHVNFAILESLPWLHPDTTSGGAAVLLEGTNMVTLTEGGKMALQAFNYEGDCSGTLWREVSITKFACLFIIVK